MSELSEMTYLMTCSPNSVVQSCRLEWLTLTIESMKGIRMNAFRNITFVFLSMLTIAGTAYGGKTEAIEGKRYSLTSQHGPWMIMVTSVSDVQGANRKDGMTAWEAADTIVYELRKKGIPAYTCSAEQLAEAETAQGKAIGLSSLLREGDICILAGNFKTIDDEKAQAVLEWVKTKFDSTVADEKKGGLFAKTPGQPSPFGGAILTLNPIYRGEVQNPEDNALMVELNQGKPYSILKNKGKYTLKVATFTGGSVLQVGNQSSSKAMGLFDAYAVDASAETDGVWFRFEGGFELKLARAGGGNQAFAKAVAEEMKTEWTLPALRRVYCASVIKDSRGEGFTDEHGKHIAVGSPELLAALEALPDFYDEIAGKAGDRKNYLKANNPVKQ